MKLELNGIDVECIIGDRAEERDRLQHLRVDVSMEIPDTAAKTDALKDTVDYAELTSAIREKLISAQCRMIERAAFLVAEVCRRDARVGRVEARVTKTGAIPHLASATAVFVMG